MEFTQNYQLRKPGDADNVLVGDLNFNMDTLDDVIKKMGNDVSSRARVVSGTYVGTGAFGSSSKNTLTFKILPKVVFIFHTSGGSSTPINLSAFLIMPFVSNANAPVIGPATGHTVSVASTQSNKKITWYSRDDAISQMNAENWTYTYVAIG